jgi:hypothetical protein
MRCSTNQETLRELVEQRFLVVVIVEANVEFGACLPRDHIARLVADIDRGEFEVRGLKLRAAVIERLAGERHDQAGDIRHRIGGAMRIGDVALDAIDVQRPRQRAAAADLDAIAEFLDVAGFAQYAMVEFLAARRHPLQQFDGAVDGDVFLVAGDQERDRAFRFTAMVGEKLQHRGDAAGDPAFHVDGPAPVQKAVLDVAGERAMGPCGLVAGRDHVGMAGKGDVRRSVADAGIEIVDIGGVRFREGDAMHLEAGGFQEILQHGERAGIRRGHRWTAQEVTGDGEGRVGFSHVPA